MLRHYPHRPNRCLDLCTMYMQLKLHHHQCLWNQDQAFYSWFLKACQSPKHQHLFTCPGLKVYQKQHKLILHQVLSGNMLLMALQVFLSYSSRNLTVTLCNGLIGHRCSNKLFVMLIYLWMERSNTFRTLWLVEQSLRLKGMVAVGILTMKHWKNWKLDLENPHLTDWERHREWRMTDRMKWETYQILCQLMSGSLKGSDTRMT